MKNTFLAVCILFTTALFAQIPKGVYVSASGGYSQPISDYTSFTGTSPEGPFFNASQFTQEITGGAHFNIDVGYQFSSLGAGLSIGTYNHSISDLSFGTPVAFSPLGGEISGIYYGLGPDYVFQLGGIQLSLLARAGLSSFTLDTYQAIYSSEALGEVALLTTTQVEGSTNLPYVSAGMKLAIPLSRKLSFIAKLDYLQTLGDGVQLTDAYFPVIDLNQDGIINDSDLGELTNEAFLNREDRLINPTMINFSAGIQYNFGTSSPRPSNDRPNSTISNKPINHGSIVFDNPSQVEPEERVLVALTPINRTSYWEQRELKKFTWELIGKKIPNAQYAIELTRINSNGTPARSYLGKTPKLSIPANEIFKGERLEDGSYIWKVIETTTGLTSNTKNFTITTCDLNYALSNDSVECLGYEGSDRKYKICFDTTYQSTTGDLTFLNGGSGLFVYDQAYNPLSYTLVGVNTSVVNQLGNASSTISYCFEVLVDSTVTDIGFGLQGDDLDPSPLICQPSVSAGISDLPSCLCDECEDLSLSLDNFSSSVNPNASNQLALTGDLNASVPIYGVEFQIQSYSYTSPNTCSPGVTSIEESGMFLQPGTAVNNATALQFANESISSDPLSNTNASKNIKYNSLTALNGSIPVALMLGLPGPAMGMDASCCLIEYEVCVKVKIFYDQGSCKSCVFTHCFNFNNQ